MTIRNETVAPKLTIFTDGGFPDLEGLSVGKVDPEIVVDRPPCTAFLHNGREASQRCEEIEPPSDNVAILALSAARDEEKPDQFQVFGRVRNYRDEDVRDGSSSLSPRSS